MASDAGRRGAWEWRRCWRCSAATPPAEELGVGTEEPGSDGDGVGAHERSQLQKSRGRERRSRGRGGGGVSGAKMCQDARAPTRGRRPLGRGDASAGGRPSSHQDCRARARGRRRDSRAPARSRRDAGARGRASTGARPPGLGDAWRRRSGGGGGGDRAGRRLGRVIFFFFSLREQAGWVSCWAGAFRVRPLPSAGPGTRQRK